MQQESEQSIQRAILDWLGYHKVFAWRQNSGAFQNSKGGFYRMGVIGAPDIVCVYGAGRCIGIEIKRKGGKLSPAQKQFQQNLEKAGGVYLLVYSVDEFIERFTAL